MGRHTNPRAPPLARCRVQKQDGFCPQNHKARSHRRPPTSPRRQGSYWQPRGQGNCRPAPVPHPRKDGQAWLFFKACPSATCKRQVRGSSIPLPDKPAPADRRHCLKHRTGLPASLLKAGLTPGRSRRRAGLSRWPTSTAPVAGGRTALRVRAVAGFPYRLPLRIRLPDRTPATRAAPGSQAGGISPHAHPRPGG